MKTANSNINEGINLLYIKYYDNDQGKTNFIDWLESNGYIDSEGVINVKNVLGSELNYGNGSNLKDVYVMAVDDNKYIINYYNSSKEEITVGEILEENATLANLKYTKNKDKYLNEAIELGQGSTNKDIGIGTDGNVVNLDLWNYSLTLDGNSIKMGNYEGSGQGTGGYDNANITKNGTIQGTIPQYIYLYEYDNWFTVTDIDCLFYGCTDLKVAPEIPSTVTSMTALFRNCTSLTSVGDFPASVMYMDYAFYGCSSLVSIGDVPDSVKFMDYMFYDCTSLISVGRLSSSITSLFYTFYNCTSLTSVGKIPATVTNMGYAFFNCTSLTSVGELPSSATNLTAAFYNCTSLTGVGDIPASVDLMWGAFYNCTSLTSVGKIPASVCNLGNAFCNCTSLTGTIEINATNLYWYSNTFSGTTQPIVLTGTSSYLSKLAATSSAGNVTVQE